MRKTFVYFLSVVLLVSIVTVSANAIEIETRSKETIAKNLKTLGLFKGVSETDFDLNRAPTRAEAVIMLIRILGKEKEAINGNWHHPFTDVAEWADKYIGYAYQNNLIKGVSATRFGFTDDAKGYTYLTYLLRALGYSDTNEKDFSWDNPYNLAKSIGVLPDSVDTNNFTRGDVALISFAALSALDLSTSKLLLTKLYEAGAVSIEAIDSVGLKYLLKPIDATDISLNYNTHSINLATKEILQLCVSYFPVNTTNRIIFWQSANIRIATVNDSGLVTPVSEGTTTILARTSNGLTALCLIFVEDKTVIETGNCGENLIWTYYSNGELEINGTGDMYNYQSFQERNSTSPWSKYRESVTKLTLNEGITSIGDCAFLFCTSLKSLNIPNSVTLIGDTAFTLCYNITGNVTLSKNVTTIGVNPFSSCAKITNVLVDKENCFYYSVDGVLFSLDKTLICYPRGKNITSYVIPSDVKKIGDRSFVDCMRLSDVYIPKSVDVIGNMAFFNCINLKNVYFYGNRPAFDDLIFGRCNKALILYYVDGLLGWTDNFSSIYKLEKWTP